MAYREHREQGDAHQSKPCKQRQDPNG
jgi:hypothetical protein